MEAIGIGGKADGRSAEMLKKNSLGEVPSMEKVDGTFMAESASICEYLDAEFGPTPVVGTTASEKGATSMWVRRVEQKVSGGSMHCTEYYGVLLYSSTAYSPLLTLP